MVNRLAAVGGQSMHKARFASFNLESVPLWAGAPQGSFRRVGERRGARGLA